MQTRKEASTETDEELLQTTTAIEVEHHEEPIPASSPLSSKAPLSEVARREGYAALTIASNNSGPVDEDEWVDPTLGGLPSYVLLVGLGVCSVVMRVVFKRIVGRMAY